jgi:hypothetical protein
MSVFSNVWSRWSGRFVGGLCALFILSATARAEDAWHPPAALSAAEKTALDALRKPGTMDSRLAPPPKADSLTAGLKAKGTYFDLPFGLGGDRVEAGYAAMRRGDIDGALRLLEEGERDAGPWSRMLVFRLAGLRADLLMRANRALDADEALARSASMERDIWSRRWITQARRGEALARRGDSAGAEGDLGRVALALRDWELDTTFEQMPDVRDLMLRTEAKIRSHMGLASLFARTGNYPRAMAWGASAEAHFRRLFELAAGPHGSMVPMVPDFYIGRGENLAYLGAGILAVHADPAPAEPYFAAARDFFQAIGYPFGDAMAAAIKAQALHDAGLLDVFHPAAVEAVSTAARAGLWEVIWRIEALRGRLFLAAGQKEEAEAALRRAQDAVELVSGGLSSDRAKLAFGVGKEDITRLLAAIDIEKGDHAALFRDLERGRARAFVDLLAGRRLAEGREAELVLEIRALDKRILHRRIANISGAGEDQDGAAAEAGFVAEWARKNRMLRERDPELAAALSIASQELATVRARLKDGDVLAYALPGGPQERIGLLLASPGATRILRLAATGEEMARRLKRFRTAIESHDPAAQRTAAESLSAALEVGAWGARRTLYFVPDGPTHFVPWGALVVEVPVVVLPTGGWLIRSPRPLAGAKAASVVGDPDFVGRLPQLPGARSEAREVAKTYGTSPLVGDAATEHGLREDIGAGVEVLHLATHGLFDADEPLQSAIVLAGPDGAQNLTAARLFEAPLAARLVILSACETGVGKVVAGNDILGLARSLYLGGATTVVHSLWPIEDTSTLEFMRSFHAGARNGDYGRAWLAARNRLRKLGHPPSAYGAFVLGGAPGDYSRPGPGPDDQPPPRSN